MSAILITSIMRQSNLSRAVTSFTNGYFSFGDTSGADTAVVDFNRTMSKAAIGTESARTKMPTPRESQGASGFSLTSIYHIKGYSAGLITTVNKITGSTDTQSSPTITFAQERRGPMGPCPISRSRIYYHGGYQDTSSTFRQETNYIATATDTTLTSTNIPAVRHVGSALFNSSSSWLMNGFTTGSAFTTTIYKWFFSNDSVSTLTAVDTSLAQGYALNFLTFGYRANGRNNTIPASSTITNTSNKKLTYATDTVSAGSNGPESGLKTFAGTQFVTSSVAYAWTGNKVGSTQRLLHQLSYATETWTNSSYSTADAGSGFVQGTSGY